MYKDGIELYHGSKSEITKQFNSATFVLPHYPGGKSDIVFESDTLFEGDSFENPRKMAESFLKTNQNKKKLNKYLPLKLLELHQVEVMISTLSKL